MVDISGEGGPAGEGFEAGYSEEGKATHSFALLAICRWIYSLPHGRHNATVPSSPLCKMPKRAGRAPYKKLHKV